jgi:hypothetical protein
MRILQYYLAQDEDEDEDEDEDFETNARVVFRTAAFSL